MLAEILKTPEKVNLVDLDWYQDFGLQAYLSNIDMTNARGRFALWSERENVLNNVDEEYTDNSIQGVLYGAMLKKIMGGKAEFKKPTSSVIEAFKMTWCRENDSLTVKAIPVDKNGDSTSPLPDPGMLFDLLMDKNKVFEPVPIPATEFLQGMGLQGLRPMIDYTVLSVDFYPVILPLTGLHGPKYYFALATKLPCQQVNPNAFGPPCPPFCYDKTLLLPLIKQS